MVPATTNPTRILSLMSTSYAECRGPGVLVLWTLSTVAATLGFGLFHDGLGFFDSFVVGLLILPAFYALIWLPLLCVAWLCLTAFNDLLGL